MRVAVVLTGQSSERALEALCVDGVQRDGIAWRRGAVDELAASGETFDVAMAGSWRGAVALSGVPARHRAWLVSAMEDRELPVEDLDRAAAAAALALPLAFLATSRAIATELEKAFPGRRVAVVPRGLDSAFAPGPESPAPAGGPLRVVVREDPREPGAGLAAVAAMREADEVEVLDETAPASARAAAYRAADVVLDLRRVAGDPVDLAEVFASGATCLTTPAGGRDELLTDGHDGLLTSWDDERGTARLLDLLAADRGLLARLRRAAWETARAWPSSERAAAGLAEALERIAAGSAVEAR